MFDDRKATGNPGRITCCGAQGESQQQFPDEAPDFQSTNVPYPFNFGALLAFSSNKKFELYEFQTGVFQPQFKTEHLWYVSMGSGQAICDPFLGLVRRVFWKNDKPPMLSDGAFATVWTLQHVVDLNPGGIKGPIEVAVLENSKNGAVARLLREGELDEHRNNIAGLEKHISEYPALLSGDRDDSDTEVPEVKKPSLVHEKREKK